MDGKRIQIRKMGSHQGFRDGKWYDVENPRWDFDSCDYRVAPEPTKPREWYLCDAVTAKRGWSVVDKEHADHCQRGSILVREVIE